MCALLEKGTGEPFLIKNPNANAIYVIRKTSI